MNIKKDLCKEIFREYDIRGEYKTNLDEDTAYTIGLTFGTKIKSLGKTTCIVGHDNRLSSDSLTNALLKGITSTGINVIYLGLVTTPMYYYACIYLKIDSGIMVTASHNPVNDNGFKITIKDYYCAVGKEIMDLYDLALSQNFVYGDGHIKEYDIKPDYLNRITEDIKLKRRLKVVLDPANAAGTVVIKDVFNRLNIDAICINDISDGSFPNHHPDPSVPANLIQIGNKVREIGADCGIALDGDADRVGLVDENGNMINIDTYMAIMCDDLIPKLDNKTILFDVKCSKQLEDEIIKLGGTPYLFRTGASYLRNKIRELNLPFGGELAGHIFYRDRWDGFDDGIYAGIRFLEVLSKTDKKASELDDEMSKYCSTPEIKIHIEENEKQKIIDKVKDFAIKNNYKIETIDGVRIKFNDGWSLVRASNTGPNLTLRFEAKTEERLNEIKDMILEIIG